MFKPGGGNQTYEEELMGQSWQDVFDGEQYQPYGGQRYGPAKVKVWRSKNVWRNPKIRVMWRNLKDLETVSRDHWFQIPVEIGINYLNTEHLVFGKIKKNIDTATFHFNVYL